VGMSTPRRVIVRGASGELLVISWRVMRATEGDEEACARVLDELAASVRGGGR
jgi:hypothetical protein